MCEVSYTAEKGEVVVDPRCSLDDMFVGAVTVGERGQVVIPAEARKKLGINTGDRLFIMAHPSREGLVLLKLDSMREFLNHMAASLSMVETDVPAAAEESVESGTDRRVR